MDVNVNAIVELTNRMLRRPGFQVRAAILCPSACSSCSSSLPTALQPPLGRGRGGDDGGRRDQEDSHVRAGDARRGRGAGPFPALHLSLQFASRSDRYQIEGREVFEFKNSLKCGTFFFEHVEV